MTASKEKLEDLTQSWLRELKKNYLDQNINWVGVYWLESFIDPQKQTSTDLILGPYIGFDTPHTRISLQKGVCGRAIRENQTLNIDDVSKNSEYLSCSLETKSEIVIPIRNSQGKPIGELDIDCKVLNGISKSLEKNLEEQVKLFEKLINPLYY
jgi:putative methionine-R-sulfoxide reductase with GAF domain